ncbi:sulfatase-like hydrolase/transferase [Paralcaligenes ginsengisoli]
MSKKSLDKAAVGNRDKHPRNVLFIMCDQLRRDYLSCYGHPTLRTPNIDWLAGRGVRFDKAYVQGAVCGPSRMSIYTGRYVSSHGAIFNFVPLRASERGLGDYLREAGIRTAVVGKTHIESDVEGMSRLGIQFDTMKAVIASEGGFEPYVRDDGIWPFDGPKGLNQYDMYLRAKGYTGTNLWHEHANSSRGENSELLSGWNLRNANQPAHIEEPDSETAFMTDRAMDFIRARGDQPWCLHLSYIKPHWPYIAPAPYHNMYGPEDILPVIRSQTELEDTHPVTNGYRQWDVSRSFSIEAVRQRVVPTYMGLIRQIDDHLGRLFEFLRQHGRLEDTLIVFTSDHGDYLGDHWLGEKELFHDTVSRVPLIIYDPSAQADTRRGSSDSSLVESIDILPTILDSLGIAIPEHIIEGRSLKSHLHGTSPTHWRESIFSEFNFGFRDSVRGPLGRSVDRCHGIVAFDGRWKYVHYDGLPPHLFDLHNDPNELEDRGKDNALNDVKADMKDCLFDWMFQRKRHPTISLAAADAYHAREQRAVKIGLW